MYFLITFNFAPTKLYLAILWYNLFMRKNLKIMEYNAVFTSEDGGGFSVSVPELSGCFSQGDTFEEAQKNIKEAIELYLEPEFNKAPVYSVDPRNQFMAPIKVTFAI
ncbi:MAG: hypothetical protein UR33_C0009G0040 [Candidatus Woesebacteria bacterium GW2011_GWA2_33_20]|uniref:HicB-like antitoxin of toxin-antitoxin system domain-containing protein n=1 Tax=Candidatus Woesebacteria bacterium GW2011_GWB1_33_22 TaxID=1618566 RepID=A0A0F9ZJM2_9BACT|nr:MAG: hypothetical protein UR33_C0009G0040 [Candidatus Woesebacteria bacterium GW2011_GWA2_33_20]KKP44294.1 MAG: hypothetical protein UR35_C0009G0005 [Candidatus Woesebacteria bacterium GW2011_GWB1_33_22]KKP46053.1 MAG: hypothetical protein UR37_C0012G0005 [Microgenomates group bacterium GW2011_GWC1_33_28]KKP49942.1 MAG: hypothetical protein UR41_C0011G0004 [Candidatus Woesebacteria bacterium GW2011_GWA1_33_33]